MKDMRGARNFTILAHRGPGELGAAIDDKKEPARG
jgi:hypothetical protein